MTVLADAPSEDLVGLTSALIDIPSVLVDQRDGAGVSEGAEEE